MRLNRLQQHLSVCLFVLGCVFLPSFAAAAQSPRYDVVYHWDGDVGRALAYREKLAVLLGLAIDSQLKVVGRGEEYGVVGVVNGTLAQAKSVTQRHNGPLRRAGLREARPVRRTGYTSLYHLSYAKGTSPQALRKDYQQIRNSLDARAQGQLALEKIDQRNYSIVLRCWASKTAAQRIVQQQKAFFKNRKFSPVLIAAVSRPAVQPAITEDDREHPLDAPSARELPVTASSPGQVRLARQGAGPRESVEGVVPAGTPGLKNKISSFFQEQQSKGRMRGKERAALVAYDLTSNSYLVNVNSQRAFQAASMIKPFVALAFFHQVDTGKLAYTAQHRHMMEAMIQSSSNPATNWFIRLLGGPAKCEAILKREYPHLFKQIRIVEYIPPGGKTYKNSAPPAEYIHFLRALWNHQLPHAKEMLRVMSLPGRDRIFCGTELPQGTMVYNKTGTTALLCGDMGILVPRTKDGRQVPYAIVGIVERASKPADYKQWMLTGGGVIRDFSSLVYEEMKRKHNLL